MRMVIDSAVETLRDHRNSTSCVDPAPFDLRTELRYFDVFFGQGILMKTQDIRESQKFPGKPLMFSKNKCGWQASSEFLEIFPTLMENTSAVFLKTSRQLNPLSLKQKQVNNKKSKKNITSHTNNIFLGKNIIYQSTSTSMTIFV